MNQNESINTKIRKGNYNKHMNYRKVSESVMRTSLHIENVFNHIEDINLLEDKWSDYVVYWVMKMKDNPVQVTRTNGIYRTNYTINKNGDVVIPITLKTHSRLGRIIVQPSRINSGGGYGYVKLLYQYYEFDEPIDLFSKIPHQKNIRSDWETENFREFLLSQEEVV